MRTRFLFILVVILSSCASVEDPYLYSLRKLPEEILHPVSSVSLEKYDVKSPTDIFYHHGSFVILDSHSEYCFNVLDLDTRQRLELFVRVVGLAKLLLIQSPFVKMNHSSMTWDLQHV